MPASFPAIGSVRALFDVNVLLAVFDPDHVFHARARSWWSGEARGGWATCPITQNGFVRIMSQASYPSRRSLTRAVETLHIGLNQPGHEFWPDDISIADPEIFDHRRILGPNQITDIYLLGLAVRNGGRLVTFDRAISVSAVRGAEAKHLAVV